jgi:phage FluMu gp28-like protein
MYPSPAEILQKLQSVCPTNEYRAISAWLETFYPYQRVWLLDGSRFSLLLKARQIGASHTYAAAAALWALFGETTTVVSVGEREALEVVEKAAKHLDALERLGSRWARRVRSSVTELRTVTGGRAIALPATSGGRSFSGNVILDEYAYHINPEKVWDGASAVTMHQGRMRVMSTPNGVGNLFHRLATDPKQHAGWRIHRVTIDAAREQGLRVDDAELWKMARGDPRVYDQLFRCSFLDADEQYIPTSLVAACSVPDTAQAKGQCYAGLDVGLTNDLSALIIVRMVDEIRDVASSHVTEAPKRAPRLDGILRAEAIDDRGLAYMPDDAAPVMAPSQYRVPVSWMQHLVTWKRTSWEAQERAIDQLFRQWPITRLCIDASGLGKVPAERLVARYGGRVEPVDFTLSTKEDLATGMYAAFNEKRVRIPSHEAQLRDDVCSLRRIVTSAGNIRYDAARTRDGHADRAWALALALHAATRPQQRYALGALPRR